MQIPTTHWIAAVVIGVYGIVSIVGGILGYVRADSIPSLVAGGIAGLLLLLCAWGVFYAPTLSLSGAIVIALLLIGRFLPKVIEARERLGEFVAEVRGGVAVAIVVGGALVIIFAVLALVTRSSPPNA